MTLKPRIKQEESKKMPRTKLHKGYNDSVKSKPQPESVMDDYETPDHLRKQLEYKPTMQKRQLQVEHAEKKLTERLAQINTRLKEDRVRVSIQRVGGSLVLQATLPLKPDEVSKDGNPNKQTKIGLGIPFNLDGLKTAEEEARELGKHIARKTFEWNEKYLGSKVPKPEVMPTIGELLEQFEEKYFLTRKRNRQSESTLKKYAKQLSRFLVLTDNLTKEAILSAIKRTKTGTATRNSLISALSVFCNTFEFTFDFKGYKNGCETKPRTLPTDKEIEEKFHNFKPSKQRPDFQWQEWQWIYGMLATYGLRDHEVFAIDIEHFTNPKNTLHELRLDETTTEGVKTGERTIFPLHPRWVELFDLKNVKILHTTATFGSRSQMIATRFERSKIGFPPYNLRHAYAVRGHELGMPIKEMADNMGHSVDMHTNHYQKWMTIDSRRVVYQKAISKADEAKTEREAIEVLKAELARSQAEIEALKTENESLKALLTEKQLQELLKQQ